MKPDKIKVACPRCGHLQLEPRDGYSSVCRKCQQHFRMEEVLRPRTGHEEKHPATRRVTCFQCGTLLDVVVEAESTMCKRCSSHIDLRNYEINQAVSKNFRTHGSFVVGEKGYVFNTEAEVGDAVIRGRFLGKIHARRTLALYAPEQFKGTFKAGLLIVPSATSLHWSKPLEVQAVDVAGELVAQVHVPGTVTLRSTGCLFGDVEAANLVMESGAVLVGNVRIGPSQPAETSPPNHETQTSTPESGGAQATELPGLAAETQPAPPKGTVRKKKQI